jgi:hypothetical protein
MGPFANPDFGWLMPDFVEQVEKFILWAKGEQRAKALIAWVKAQWYALDTKIG